MRGKLFFTIAPARAGKSTFADKWVRYQEGGKSITDSDRPRVIVCADNIRLAMHGMRYAPDAEDHVHAVKHTMIKALLDRGHDVLVDGTHTTLASVRSLWWIEPTAEPFWIPSYEEINGPQWADWIHILHMRAVKSGQSDLHPIIDRMCQQVVALKACYHEEKVKFWQEHEARKVTHRIV